MYVCEPCVYSAGGGQKPALDSLELEFQIFVSLCVGAGN